MTIHSPDSFRVEPTEVSRWLLNDHGLLVRWGLGQSAAQRSQSHVKCASVLIHLFTLTSLQTLEYLLELIQQYKLEKNVEFVGNISAAEMKKYMIESNIFLMASSVENSSNSLGEAMLLGVPAVVSRVGGLSSLMEEDEGHYYKSGSIEDMTKAIGDVFDDQDEAIARAVKGKEHAREIFDPEKNLEQLLNIYKEIEETI